MNLLAPLGLLALLTLPIIILLHLRRERLRRIVIPSLMHWQQIPQTTGKKRKMLLPLSLLLLLHLLIASLLALALAQPQWLGSIFAGSNTQLAILIDTSTSMAASESGGITRIELARTRARALINELGATDTAVLVSLGTDPNLLATGTGNNRSTLLAALEQAQPIGTGNNLPAALTLARAALEQSKSKQRTNNGPHRIIIISDLEPPAAAELPAEHIEWLQIGTPTPNAAVVALTAQPRIATSGTDIYARIANYGDQPQTLAVTLYGDDQPIDSRPVQLTANGEVELTWTINTPTTILRASIEQSAADTRDALALDNVAALSLTGTRPAQILLVSDTPARLQRVLSALPGTQTTTVSPAAYPNSPLARTADITIFHNAMPVTLPSGGVLIINPPPTNGAAAPFAVSAGAPLPEDIPESPARIPAGAPEQLEAINLESIEFGTLVQVAAPQWLEPRLVREQSEGERSESGDEPIILRGYTGTSQVAVWTFDIEQSTLPGKIAFPVLVALTIRDLQPPTPPATIPVGQPLTMQAAPRTTRVELTAPDGKQQTLTVSPTVQSEPLFATGIYTLRELAGSEVLYDGQLAVNAGSPLESNLTPRPMPVLATPYLATTAADGQSEGVGDAPEQPIWHVLVGLALLVLLAEWLYVHLRI